MLGVGAETRERGSFSGNGVGSIALSNLTIFFTRPPSGPRWTSSSFDIRTVPSIFISVFRRHW